MPGSDLGVLFLSFLSLAWPRAAPGSETRAAKRNASEPMRRRRAMGCLMREGPESKMDGGYHRGRGGRFATRFCVRKREPPGVIHTRGFDRPGNNLLSPSTDYHRPRMLD